MKIRKRLPVNLRSLILFLAIISMIITLTNAYIAIYNVQKKVIIDHILRSNLNYSAKLAATTENFFSSAQQELAYSATQLADNFNSDDRLQEKSELTYHMNQIFNSVFVADSSNHIRMLYPPSSSSMSNNLASDASKLALTEQKPLISQPYLSAGAARWS